MQSAAPHVLAALDRRHTPGRAVAAAREARAAGFEHVSLDLIYGTPGESDADWRASLDAALSAEPDHVSAYALTVERGTALHAKRTPRHGARRPTTTCSPTATRSPTRCSPRRACAGTRSPTGRGRRHQCRHNLGYWRGEDWWGIGPGAHSHVAGVRWWNARRPADYALRLAAGRSPRGGRERARRGGAAFERLMLGFASPGLDGGLVAAARRCGGWRTRACWSCTAGGPSSRAEAGCWPTRGARARPGWAGCPAFCSARCCAHVDATRATVWAETEARARCRSSDAHGRRSRVCGRHYAIVVVEGLEPDRVQPYEVELDGVRAWPLENWDFPPSVIRTIGTGRRKLRICFGSCRCAVPHVPP